MTEHEHDNHEDHEDGYTGPATLLVEETELEVEVELRGHFQPIDGYYHWYGRVKANERLSTLAGGRKKPAEIRTPEGSAKGEVSDPDPWDRYRLTGTSTPPFTVPTTLDQVEA
ncbi:DUF4873 domain-containing protein [Amycolatopsis aidingensis]|uniref:DUF4873 domain-containing protein n=1 Tax=Amycolatopsis aidingensis TaxID=2842453 RepID=UPI001C0D3123|nr:DUF4873 domain-containing protein [Amycolatopsis aidingensis]